MLSRALQGMLGRLLALSGRALVRPELQGGPCLACRASLLSTAAKAAQAGKKGSKKKKKKDGEGGDASKNAWHISILDAPVGPGSEALPEEVRERNAQIGHTYNVMYNKRERAVEADLHRKIKLKQEAINALPRELQEEARTVDTTPFPPNRRLTTWTPPIPGFDASRYDLPGSG